MKNIVFFKILYKKNLKCNISLFISRENCSVLKLSYQLYFNIFYNVIISNNSRIVSSIICMWSDGIAASLSFIEHLLFINLH